MTAYLARNPFEMTRVRNSLIAVQGSPADFDWTPDEVPEEFQSESMAPPGYVSSMAKELVPDESYSDLDRAFAIAKLLASGNPPGGGTVQGTTEQAIRTITETNKGNCSDYTQAFVGLSLALGVPVREWGMSYDGFSGRGHAFNEIYDTELRKWIFVDSYNSFYAVDRETKTPLSALEFRDYLALPDPLEFVQIVPIDADAQGFRGSASTTVEHYKAGIEQFFLWYGNSVFSYEADPVVRIASRFGRAAEQIAAIAKGTHPEFRVVPLEAAAAPMRKLQHYKALLVAAVVLCASGVIGVLLALLRLRISNVRPKVDRKGTSNHPARPA
jgi:hypothetical protein